MILAAAGAAWWLPVLPIAILVLLLVRVAVMALKPGMVGVTVIVALVIAALVGTYSLVAATLADGVVETGHIKDELRQRIEHSRAIQLLDEDNRLLGILPAVFDPTRADSPYLAIPMRAEDVPPVFWACARYLEDRDLDAPWHILGIDFRRLGTAVLSKLSASRAGAVDVLAEMLDRSSRRHAAEPASDSVLRTATQADELAPICPCLTRSLSWTEADLKSMVATHLTLMTPGPGARFGGGEIHGVALAAAVLGKRPGDLTAAEQALLAGAINLPLLIGDKATWRKPRERADYCLAHAPLGDGFDRDRARRELRRDFTPPQAKVAASRRAGGGPFGRSFGRALVRELSTIVGPDWPQRVVAVRLSVRQPLPGLPEEMAKAAREVERRQAGHLAVPIWTGDDAALLYGVVADSNGEILASVSNSDIDMSASPTSPLVRSARLRRRWRSPPAARRMPPRAPPLPARTASPLWRGSGASLPKMSRASSRRSAGRHRPGSRRSGTPSMAPSRSSRPRCCAPSSRSTIFSGATAPRRLRSPTWCRMSR